MSGGRGAFLGLAFACVLSRCAGRGSEGTSSSRASEPEDERIGAAEASPLAAEPDERPIGLGITVDEVRRATDEASERAREAGAAPGDSFAVCAELEAAGLVARCAALGPMGAAIDRTSFELPDATAGRGIIQHFDADASYATARRMMDGLAADVGTFVAGSARARLLLAGGEQWPDADRARVRAIIEAR